MKSVQNNSTEKASHDQHNIDWIIITASNKNQAKSYQKQINAKRNNELLDNTRIDIVPDKNDKRIGSGGATLNVIKFIQKTDQKWENKKILLIHSGGDSKRIPQYSACGKLFSHIPKELPNGNPSTLFDELIMILNPVFRNLQKGMLIASGDVLPLFSSIQNIPKETDAIAISMKEKAEIGKNHGVFLEKNGILSKFLHKNSIKELSKKGAIDNKGNVNIDTGLIWLSNNILNDLSNLITNRQDEKKYINDTNRLSFYGDLLYPLSTEGTLEEYITLPAEGTLDENLKECRQTIWNVIHKYKLNVALMNEAEFIHIGTTKEMLTFNTSASVKYPKQNWKENILTNQFFAKTSIINSFIKEKSQIGKNCFIEDSIIENVNIGDNCVISGAELTQDVKDNTVIHLLPIKYNKTKKYVARIYGINDNPKENGSLLGQDLISSLERYNLLKQGIWKGEDKSLWEANIYEICDTEKNAINATQRLQKIISGNATENEIEIFKNSPRISMKESFVLADMNAVIKRQIDIKEILLANQIIRIFLNGEDAKECLRLIQNNNPSKIIKHIEELNTNNNYKIYSLLSYLSKKINLPNSEKQSQRYEDKSYNLIKEFIKQPAKSYDIVQPVKNVTISSPVRINFGGGWSDTPPYCIENGGTVLNASILLNSKKPISVTVERNKKNHFVFKSIDQNALKEYKTTAMIRHLETIGDPFIISKAALIALGIIDNPIFAASGIKIITESNVPAGSGLGTSSILAGTITKALCEFYSIKISDQELFNTVMRIEQLISAGGGWQDQIGGLTLGHKIIKTAPGQYQKFDIEYLEQNSIIKELEQRSLLIYTGQRRIAKNLLRKIMNKYLWNEPIAIRNLDEIKQMAINMKNELKTGTVDNFATMLTKHFEKIKEIDPSITNNNIEEIIAAFIDKCSGYTIAGAGGGGFMFVVLDKEQGREKTKKELYRQLKHKQIQIYDCEFNYK